MNNPDNFRKKIADFFNNKWRKKEKNKIALFSYNLDDLIKEYARVYGTTLSRGQIVGLLCGLEIERLKDLPDYKGKYHLSNLTKLKDEYTLVKKR